MPKLAVIYLYQSPQFEAAGKQFTVLVSSFNKTGSLYDLDFDLCHKF